MKILYIISLVVSVIFIGTISHYVNEYQDAALDAIFSSWSSYSYDSYSYDSYAYDRLDDITAEGSLVALLFMIFYILTFAFTLRHIKRSTARVMSIIGLSLSGLLLLITMIPAFDPGGISYDELGPMLLLYVLVMLAFCIVNLVQAVRNDATMRQQNPLIVDEVA